MFASFFSVLKKYFYTQLNESFMLALTYLNVGNSWGEKTVVMSTSISKDDICSIGHGLQTINQILFH